MGTFYNQHLSPRTEDLLERAPHLLTPLSSPKKTREKIKPSSLTSHLLTSACSPPPALPFLWPPVLPGAQVILPDGAPMCPSFTRPPPPLCHTPCICPAPGGLAKPIKPCPLPIKPVWFWLLTDCAFRTFNPSEATVLRGETQPGLYITQQGVGSVYLLVFMFGPLPSALCGVRQQLRAPLLDKCL